MRRLASWVLALTMGCALVGCGKKEPAADTPAPEAPAAAAPAAAPTAASAAAENAAAPEMDSSSTIRFKTGPPRPDTPPPVVMVIAGNLEDMTQALRKYSAEHQRVPASFAEFLQTGAIDARQLPELPPGKKYAIDPARVAIVAVDATR